MNKFFRTHSHQWSENSTTSCPRFINCKLKTNTIMLSVGPGEKNVYVARGWVSHTPTVHGLAVRFITEKSMP